MDRSKAMPCVKLELSQQLSDHLQELATRYEVQLFEIVQRALALYDVALNAHENDERLGTFDSEGTLIKVITGICTRSIAEKASVVE